MLISNNMHELQQILLQKLPRLSELKPWCKIEYNWEVWYFVCKYKTTFAMSLGNKTGIIDYTDDYKIIWSDFNHLDLLEALGKDFAMTGDYQLLFFPRWHTSMVFWMDMWPQWIEKGITLPSNISDLSLPEYEETRKQLISLLK